MNTYTTYSGEIASQLAAYRAHGQKEAANHRPPSDAARLDQHETTLVAEAEKWLASDQRIFDSNVTDASHTGVDVQQKALELQTRIDQLISDNSLPGTVELELSGDRPALAALTEARMRAEVDLRAFKATNRITEQAVYPDSRWMHFATIAILALIETVVNAFFYENAQGLLGGFAVALGVAGVNMIGALVLGYFFRFKNLASPDKKLFGWFAFAVFVVLAVYCNALFSSFRAEYQLLADPSDPLQLRRAFAQATGTASRVFVFDMSFADLMSFILFGLGTLLSGFAFYKGYTIDDRYPGHGSRDRRVRTARRAEIEKQDILRQKVKDLLQRYRSDVQAAIHEPTHLTARVSTQITQLQHARSMLTTHTQAIQRDLALVLAAYRDANTAVRATDPPPYFRESVDLSRRTNPDAAESLLNNLTQVQSDLKLLRDKNQDALNERVRVLQNEGSTLNRAFGEFILEVEAEAQESINRMTPTIERLG